MKTQTNNLTYSKTILVFAIILLLAGGEMWGQNFIMEGENATYQSSCSGVIKLKSAGTAGQHFQNIAPLPANPLGTSGNPIPGIVDWAATGDGQTVQGNFYYEHLVVSGGDKTLADGIHVTGNACTESIVGYSQIEEYPFYSTATGDLTFEGTFNYEGTTATIFPLYTATGTQPNNYNILNLSGGGTITAGEAGLGDFGATNVILASGTTLNIEGNLYTFGGNSQFDGPVEILASGSINPGTGNLVFDNTLTITNGDLIVQDGDGSVTIDENGSLNLVGDLSVINFGDNTNLIITGAINNGGNGQNLVFDCGSTVTYNSTVANQSILPTLNTDTHRYGNLVLSGANKQGGQVTSYPTNPYADIYSCGNFALADGNLDMVTNSGLLYLTSTTASVTYGVGNGAGDNEEVIGRFGRTTSADLATYMFNNRYTTIDLEADADNPTMVEMYVESGENPYSYVPLTDVNRKVNLTYTGGTGNEFVFEAGVGYLSTEKASWADPYGHSTLRFYEADATPSSEKVGTGEIYSKTESVGSELGQIKLANIKNTTSDIENGIGFFKSGNDLVLRSGPTTFYSVNDGRWTNPNTWDEGQIPSSLDDAEVRTMVYVGIPGPFAGTDAGNNTTTEVSKYADGKAANTITIASGTTFPGASLVIANLDNEDGYVFQTSKDNGTTFINNNTQAPTLAFPLDLATYPDKGDIPDRSVPANQNIFNGLWLLPYGSSATRTSIFGTNQLQNYGKVRNEGIIEVGQ